MCAITILNRAVRDVAYRIVLHQATERWQSRLFHAHIHAYIHNICPLRVLEKRKNNLSVGFLPRMSEQSQVTDMAIVAAFLRKVCKNRERFFVQKRSFCSAIPIVLLGKVHRIAAETDSDCAAKPIVLVRKAQIFREKRVRCCSAEAGKRAFRGWYFR